MRRGWVVPVTLAAGWAATAGGCSDDGEEAAAGSLTAMLELVPDGGAVRDQVIYGSLERVRDLSGAGAQGEVGDEISSLMEVTTAWVVAEPFFRAAGTIEPDELGFDLRAIDASIQAGTPPDDLSVFLGRIDAERVDDAMTTFEPFADELEQDEREGVRLYRFGDEFAPERITPARPLGVGGFYAAAESTVWKAGSDSSLDAVAAVARGDGESLADVDGFIEVAEVLDADDAYTAVLLGNPELARFDPTTILGQGASPELIDELTERFGATGLARWDVAGLGEQFAAGDPGSPELVIVLWHADEAAAERNETSLAAGLAEGQSVVTGEPWAELCADADVVRDGGIVTATCTPRTPGLAVDIVLTRDALLAWE